MAKWNPPAQGSKARAKMPRSAFLDSENRRYPYKTKSSSGRWKISDRGLMAAYRRAAQQGHTSIKNKALAILNRRRKRQGKSKLPG